MIPALQPSSRADAELLLPAAALQAAAAPLEHMLGCEVTQEEASVWVECVCSHVGMAMVIRACSVTQVRPLLRQHHPCNVMTSCSLAATSGHFWQPSLRTRAYT
jgi:hypothetical protein